MGITPMFSVADLLRGAQQEVERIEQMIQNELIFLGLEFVRTARVQADFTDRTGNLRSSIGFMVLKNGEIIHEDFEVSQSGTDKQTGKAKGYEYAMEQAGANLGFILIVVAGMEYAVYVEAKGYDVITGSSIKAEEDLKRLFEKLGSMK